MDAALTATWKPEFERLHKANAQKVAEEIMSIGESATPAQITSPTSSNKKRPAR